MSQFVIGTILFAVGLILFVLGLPKNGVSPRFLQFDAALVLFPPLVLVFIALGAAELIAAALGLN